jgi:hypothetical protein
MAIRPGYRTKALEREFRLFVRVLLKHGAAISRGVGVLEAKLIEDGVRIELSGGDITIATNIVGQDEETLVHALFDVLDEFINQNMRTKPAPREKRPQMGPDQVRAIVHRVRSKFTDKDR